MAPERERRKPKKPFADTAIARFLDKTIEELKHVKTQREIADEVGYPANMISMIKNGDAKVPLDKIGLLARALGVDASHLFRLALEQYWPEMGDLIQDIFGRICSENELALFLAKWRLATKNTDPRPTAHMQELVDRMIRSLVDVSAADSNATRTPME